MSGIFGLSLLPAPAGTEQQAFHQQASRLSGVHLGSANGSRWWEISERERGAERKAGLLVPRLRLCKVTRAGCAPHRASLPLQRGPAQQDPLLPGLNLLSLPLSGRAVGWGGGNDPAAAGTVVLMHPAHCYVIWSFREQVLFGLS